MATATKNRIKSAAVTFVPQSRTECTEAIAEIGRAQRERARIQAAMNDALAKTRQHFEEQAKPFADVISQRTLGVQTWCETHRAELTVGGKTKTVNLASGEVRWRMRPPSVLVRGGDLVIEALRSLGLQRFLREKVEVNKEAILADPEAVKAVRGITVTQREDFVIVPFETELEEVL
jgi:phage host-nuclease inhibitor protein Gam